MLVQNGSATVNASFDDGSVDGPLGHQRPTRPLNATALGKGRMELPYE